MKRKLLSLLILALLPLMASADAVQIEGIYYNLDAEAKTAEVTSNPNKYSGDIIIPETVYNHNDGVIYDVTSIGDEAFRWCHEITSIVFPTQLKLKSIGFAAMYACSNLTSVVLPEGLVSIGQKAFTDCTSLESVTVPSTVTKIDPSAFNGCPSLTSFICKIETPLEIKESVFGDRSIITLYVPEGCKDAYVNSEYWQGFKEIVEGGEGTNLCPDSNHPHMIDLGLPSGTKWSCCNVGADKPESFGGYYAWGETEEKEKYSWETYLYGDGSDYGAYDIGVDIAGTTYDVAYVKQGSNWRMPTLDQMEEITSSCTSEWTTLNDVKGLKITGSNGNSIFLPAAGEKYTYGSTDGLTGDGVKGHYWTSNCQPDFIGNVRLLNFAEDLCGIGSYGRSDGITVRAVASSFSDNEDVIAFADAKVKAICVENWDTNGDGELSYEEAAAVTDLGEVFEGNEEITSFNELKYFTGLTKISEAAFFGDYALKSVELPMGLTSIEHAAFGICSSLTSIFIPKNVTTINGTSFRDCTSLVEITVDGENPVYESPRGCNAIINKNTKTLITGCKVTVVPDGVEIIGPSAFYGQYSIKELVLPASVKQIGSSSYDGCGFETLVIPNTVERIDYAAFWNCHSLATIKLPAKTPALSSEICSNCKKLKEIISLNPNPTAISDDVFIVDFDGTMPDATLYVPVGSKAKYEAAGGWKRFKKIVETNTIEYKVNDTFTVNGVSYVVNSIEPRNVIVGSGEISDNIDNATPAIDRSTEGTLVIPASVTGKDGNNYTVIGFGYAAFSGCQLTSVTIPETVTTIGDYAFHNCALTSITIPSSVKAIKQRAFQNCSVLKTVNFSEGLESIGWAAFQYCFALESVVLPNGLKTMEGRPFKYCSSLKSVSIPGSLERVEQDAFASTKLTSVVIPEGVKFLGASAFSVSSLTSVTIPKSVNEYQGDPFYSANIETVINMNPEPVKLNGSIFANGIANATLYVPAGSKEAYTSADYWKGFKEILEVAVEEEVVYVPNVEEKTVSVETSDKSATEVEIRSEVEIEGEKYEVTSIGEGAFANNTTIEKVTIPETISEIGNNAFAGCTGLKEIRVFAEEPIQLGSSTAAGTRSSGASSVFAEVDVETCVLYVPAGSKEKYEQADGWSDFKNIVEMGETAAVTISISAAQQLAYCSDKALDFKSVKGLKAFVATGYDKATGVIWLTRVNDVPANTGFLLMGAEGSYEVPVIEGGSDSYYKNMFKGTLEAMTLQTTENGYTNYYLSKGTNGVGFYKVTNANGQSIGANRAYLPIPTEIPAVGKAGSAETIKVSAAGQVPYFSSQSLDFTSLENVKAYTATGYDYKSGTIWLTRVKQVPAETGILIMAPQGSYDVPTASVASVYGNMLKGTLTGSTIYTNEKDGAGVEYTNYYLSNGANGVGFYKVTNEAGQAIGANRAYLPIPVQSAAGTRAASSDQTGITLQEAGEVIALPLLRGIADGSDGTTSIREVKSGEVDGEEWFTLQGQRVAKPGKGVYIKNGKKVVIK